MSTTVEQRKLAAKKEQNNNKEEVDEIKITPATSVNGNEKRVLFILFLTLVLDLLAFTCILPLFPAILDHYAAISDKVRYLFAVFLVGI